MKSPVLFFSILLIILSGCKKDNNNSESCYSNNNAQTIIHDGINREYVLYIPNSYDGTSAVPLMLNFHGFGGSASDYMQEADMRSLAEADTFILIYPQGSCSDGLSHWNACPLGGDNKSDADDFGFIESMITEISSQYNVDMERIYAAGYSNGGMMAYGLANYKSDLIAAVASVSGVMLYLKFFEGMAYEEIAALTEMKYQSVVNTVYRAIKEIRENLSILLFLIVTSFFMI